MFIKIACLVLCVSALCVSTVGAQDSDRDGILDPRDNCISVHNPAQADSDGDGRGTACDNCPSTANANQADDDGDGDGNVCDNCPMTVNGDQLDTDTDTIGDQCDNCPFVTNRFQEDQDHDSRGDICDFDDVQPPGVSAVEELRYEPGTIAALPPAGVSGRTRTVSDATATSPCRTQDAGFAFCVDNGLAWSAIAPGASPALSALSYGAVGDGVADDTTALLAMFNAVSNKRGSFHLPAGTYNITASIKFPKTNSSAAKIVGDGIDRTIISYTGSSWAFVLNDGTGSGDARQITFQDLTIQINSPALGAVLIRDAANDNTFDRVKFSGYGTATGTGVAQFGQASCACYSAFYEAQFTNLKRGVWWSGFSNANLMTQGSFQITNTAMDISAVGANAHCAADKEPFACCSGAGAGTGAAECAADTSGGDDNLVERTEFGSQITLAMNLGATANGNVFVKTQCDGPTACLTMDNAADANTFVGSLINPAATLNGDSARNNTFLASDPASGARSRNVRMGNSVYGEQGIALGVLTGSSFAHLHSLTANNVFVRTSTVTTGSSGTDGAIFGITDADSIAWAWNYENSDFIIGTNNVERLRVQETGVFLYASVAFASLGTPVNGSLTYCSDCTIANPCAGSGTGAFAKRLNGAWVCN